MAALIGSIEPFDPTCAGSCFESYLERMRHLFIVNEVPENCKLSYFITLIGGQSYEILKNLVAPRKPSNITFDEAVEVLKKHFSPPRLVVAERFKFYKLQQLDNESVANFIVRLRNASQHCDFSTFLDDALRDRLICGLAREDIQKKLLSTENLTFSEACKIGVAMEAMVSELRQLHVAEQRVEQGNVNVVNSKPSACYRCGRFHNPATCPVIQWSCRGCGEQGHIQRMCRRKIYVRNLASSADYESTDDVVEDNTEVINLVEHKKRRAWREAIATTEIVFKITGIWPQQKRGYWSSIRLFIFITLSLIFDATIIVELGNLMITQDYEALSTHLSTFGLYIGYSIKILIFQFQKNDFLNMLNIIDLPIFEDYPPRMEKYKTNCISISNGIANFYISCVAVSVFMYLNKPLYTDASLPISFSYDLNSLTYVLILALQCFGNYYLVMIGISFDMIIIGLINIATAQLDILIDTIVAFRPKNVNCLKNEEHEFLKQCIKRHQTNIRFVNETENIFTYIFLTQCLSSVISICNGAFQLTHTDKLMSIHFIFNCAFAFDVLFEIGICCWFAGLLTIKSLEVADACYNYNWLNSPPSTKKLLLIILVRSQRSLFITAGKYAKLSMTSFLMVLKTAYSYFALMQSLYDKKNNQ